MESMRVPRDGKGGDGDWIEVEVHVAMEVVEVNTAFGMTHGGVV